MNEMVERVAAALFNAENFRWPSDAGEPEGDHYDWFAATDDEQVEYREKAREAIKAMKDPTNALREYIRYMLANKSGKPLSANAAEREWRSMIAEILKKDPA